MNINHLNKQYLTLNVFFNVLWFLPNYIVSYENNAMCRMKYILNYRGQNSFNDTHEPARIAESLCTYTD